MPSINCPIIAIGASAGGLASLKAFFKHMPSNAGAAYVIIQHLDPKHESLTPQILSHETVMPTIQVTDGMKVKPNNIYLIPPNAYMTINKSVLSLQEPILKHGLRLPIDTFFMSLAQNCQQQSIVIILSGTGYDGSFGLKKIKENGGFALAQSPDTAEYPGMPKSAIDTGLIDITCNIEAMPKHITDYLKHPYINPQTYEDTELVPRESIQLKNILALLHLRTGHDFKHYKQGTLIRRIARRLSIHNLNTLSEYYAYMRKNEAEVSLLFKDLLIGVTDFFRDIDAFTELKKEIIDPLVESKKADDSIRVWVPACSSGEEAYSIGMLLIEKLEEANKHCHIQIFASDIDDAALYKARAGLYCESMFTLFPSARLKRFFNKEADGYKVKKELREMVTFASQNIISDPPFSNLDLISCRNLLIYLNTNVQSKVFSLFHFALNKNGALFLGQSETCGQQAHLFKAINKKYRIYRRCDTIQSYSDGFSIGSTRTRHNLPNRLPKNKKKDQMNFADITQYHLLQEFAPAAVLVDDKHQVLHFFGPTAAYIEQPTGAPTQDILSLVKQELRGKLRIALRKVFSEKERITFDDLSVLQTEKKMGVKIVAKPIQSPEISTPLALITFEMQPLVPTATSAKLESGQLKSTLSDEESSIQQMEDELYITREELQSNIEELEATTEELQASNEEVMSVNEELQSSNEELESSKEELQAINEELTTVNNQYKEKVEELTSSQDDIENLLSSTEIATIFVDSDMNIGHFTTASKGLFNLLPSDIGRPFTDIRLKFDDKHLLAEIQEVISKLTPFESEIISKTGEYYLKRILPYRANDNRKGGVVITFIDITQLKKSEFALQASESNFKSLIESAPDALIIINSQGQIEIANKQAELLFGYKKQELLNMKVEQLMPTRFRSKHVAFRKNYEKEPTVRLVGSELELYGMNKAGKEIPIEVSLSPIWSDHGTLVSAAVRDISLRLASDNALREAKLEAESALNTKSRFLATASHDLRQPLHALMLLNKALMKSIGEKKAKKMLSLQEESLTGMSQLLNSLLDITKLESNKILVSLDTFSLSDILSAIVAQYNDEASEKKLAINIEVTDTFVFTDLGLFKQLVQNLLSNAIRYTIKGSITLTCAREDDHVRISIKDTGVGIPKDQQKLIFDEFHQVNRNPQERHGGIGLGLSIVSRLADLLHTKIDLDSEVGRGSTFSFLLPLAPENMITVSKPIAIEAEPVLDSSVVLIIDNDLGVLESSEMFLSLVSELDIKIASSPSQAYTVVKKSKPKLLISDYHLNDSESGYDVIKHIRQQFNEMLPAILITGDTSMDLSNMQNDDIEVLTKPINPDHFIGLVKHLLSNERASM